MCCTVCCTKICVGIVECCKAASDWCKARCAQCWGKACEVWNTAFGQLSRKEIKILVGTVIALLVGIGLGFGFGFSRYSSAQANPYVTQSSRTINVQSTPKFWVAITTQTGAPGINMSCPYLASCPYDVWSNGSTLAFSPPAATWRTHYGFWTTENCLDVLLLSDTDYECWLYGNCARENAFSRAVANGYPWGWYEVCRSVKNTTKEAAVGVSFAAYEFLDGTTSYMLSSQLLLNTRPNSVGSDFTLSFSPLDEDVYGDSLVLGWFQEFATYDAYTFVGQMLSILNFAALLFNCIFPYSALKAREFICGGRAGASAQANDNQQHLLPSNPSMRQGDA